MKTAAPLEEVSQVMLTPSGTATPPTGEHEDRLRKRAPHAAHWGPVRALRGRRSPKSKGNMKKAPRARSHPKAPAREFERRAEGATQNSVSEERSDERPVPCFW